MRCDALPSTNPVETMAEAAGYDLAKSGGRILSTSLYLTDRARQAYPDRQCGIDRAAQQEPDGQRGTDRAG